MIKTKKLLVQKTVDNMVQKYQRALNQKRDLIIADLESKEQSLISKLIQNPKIWNSKSLEFNLKTGNNTNFSSAIALDVKLTKVDLRSDAEDRHFFIFSSWMKHDKLKKIENYVSFHQKSDREFTLGPRVLDNQNK